MNQPKSKLLMPDNKVEDIEITVRMTIPNAVSREDLAEFYSNDPLRCARDIVKTGGLIGATSKKFTVESATIKGK